VPFSLEFIAVDSRSESAAVVKIVLLRNCLRAIRAIVVAMGPPAWRT
jgi:hypothetical protein